MVLKKTHILLIILLAVSIGIVISTISDVDTYSDFEEAALNQEREYHIIGKLNINKPIDTQISYEGNSFTFYMYDRKGTEKKVVFYGEKPQDFEKSEQVVLIGKMKNDIFEATHILLKCPSKYDKEGNDTQEEFKGKN